MEISRPHRGSSSRTESLTYIFLRSVVRGKNLSPERLSATPLKRGLEAGAIGRILHANFHTLKTPVICAGQAAFLSTPSDI